MSSLQRYKKSGGFEQLLTLIEGFGPQKREKFLEMIEVESAPWARALRERILTVDRVFGWPETYIVDVLKQLPPKTLAYCLIGVKPEQRAKVDPYFSAAEQRRLNDVLTENKPKPEEIASSVVKLLEMARKMIHAKELHIEKFDTGLMIPEDFESKLEDQAHMSLAHAIVGDDNTDPLIGAPAAAPAAASSDHAEVTQLQRTLALVVKENKTLKDELRVLKDKLEQIRKIA